MPRSISVFIVCVHYRLLDSPEGEPPRDERGERCDFLIDHEQGVIWLDRAMDAARRLLVATYAVSAAWAERLDLAPVVG